MVMLLNEKFTRLVDTLPFTVHFRRRDQGERLQPPGLFVVEELDWLDMGGPSGGSLLAFGNEADLTMLFDLLRCPVEIRDKSGNLWWWGFVEAVELQNGPVHMKVDLAKMANRIAVSYNTFLLDLLAYARQQTAWASNWLSLAEFGTKERLVSLAGATSSQATTRRDQELATWGLPRNQVDISETGQQVARLTLRGWWSTLGWQHWSNAAGIVEYTDANGAGEAGDTFQYVGADAACVSIAQSWTSSESWRVEQGSIKIRKMGAPADNLTVDLCADGGGAPGAVLATGSLGGASVGLGFRWCQVFFGTPYTIAANTTYWLRISRTGGLDALNYYVANVNPLCGYPGGVCLLDGGGIPGLDRDMLFGVYGGQESTEQVRAICDPTTGCGQFFTGFQLDQASGVWTDPYQVGAHTGLVEVEELLKVGTSAGLGLLGWVGPDRRLIIKARPVLPELVIRQDGRIEDLAGNPLAGCDMVGKVGRVALPWLGGANQMIIGSDLVYLSGARWTRAGGLQPILG